MGHNSHNANYLDHIKAKYKLHINYQDKTLESRMQNVEKFLCDINDWLVEYNDNYLNVNLNASSSLTTFSPISRILSQLTDYILSATDVVEEGLHTEYNFQKKLSKELPLSCCFDDVSGDDSGATESLMHLLKTKNHPSIVKTKNSLKKNLNTPNMSDEYNVMWAEYNNALLDITNKIKNNQYNNRYKFTKLKKDLLEDMNEICNHYFGGSNLKVGQIKNHYNAYQNQDISLTNLFDFSTDNVSLQDVRSFRMLCVIKNEENYSDNCMVEIVEDFKKILNKIYISNKGRNILSCIGKGYTYDDISNKLLLQKSYISKTIKSIIIAFKKYYNLNKIILQLNH